MKTPIRREPNRPPSRFEAKTQFEIFQAKICCLPLKEPVAKERTRTGMNAVLATLSEFQLKTLDAENRIDNENDCHADSE